MRMQNELVLNYMEEHGSITSQEAVRELGVYRLSARIYDLKERGLKIQAERETGVNRYNVPTRYNRYYLIEGANE